MEIDKKNKIDFYDRTCLKSYNLNAAMRYQLSMLDSLDLYTRKHCENVATLTCSICEYLHLRKSFTEYCTICAYLHDIGKLFIPPNILQKPGRLTDEEYEIIKTHTTVGYKMCINDEKLRPYALGPKFHHEALNGTGYPSGLKGRQIPYEAQIIRVADEFDAIASKRQYKSHVGITDTLKLLIENAHNGKNNPRIVRALIKVISDDTEYEIYTRLSYLEFLEDNISRLKLAQTYLHKMKKARLKHNKSYYEEGVKQLLELGEDFDNLEEVLEQYKISLKERTKLIEDLKNELKEIKKLHV